MITIPLHPALFGERERLAAQGSDVEVRAFRYPSGVEGLRVLTPRLEMEVLPFRGQQLWRLRLDGEDVGMRGMLLEPTAMPTLLESFGAMFYHCGLLGTAAPGPEDTHPLHGELPQAPMGAAALEVEEGPGGTRLRVTGSYQHARAFAAHYRAEPSIALIAGEAKVEEAGRAQLRQAQRPTHRQDGVAAGGQERPRHRLGRRLGRHVVEHGLERRGLQGGARVEGRDRRAVGPLEEREAGGGAQAGVEGVARERAGVDAVERRAIGKGADVRERQGNGRCR